MTTENTIHPERTISKRPENDGVYEESVWGINILYNLFFMKSYLAAKQNEINQLKGIDNSKISQ